MNSAHMGQGGSRNNGGPDQIHLCCIAHNTKHAVRKITSTIIETVVNVDEIA